MISYVLFTLSGLCFAAMLTPSKKTKPAVKQDYSYYVCEDVPMPTWQRKSPLMAQVAGRRD